MSFFIKAWNDFFFSRFDPMAIAIFRIFLGIAILLMLLAGFSSWEDIYSKEIVSSERWSIFVKYFWWLGFVFSITFILGLFTKFSTIVLYFLFHSMINSNPFIAGGHDYVVRMLLLFSCFAPLNYSLSVDSFFNKRNKGLPLIWSVRLIQISVVLVYMITFLYKLVRDSAWLSGDAVYYILTSNTWGRFPCQELFISFNGSLLLCKIATYTVLLVEGLFPILVWFKRTKLLVICAVTVFHILIAIKMLHVTFFSLVMISTMWIFIPSSTIFSWFNFFRGVLKK